jgi:hypothetical protein
MPGGWSAEARGRAWGAAGAAGAIIAQAAVQDGGLAASVAAHHPCRRPGRPRETSSVGAPLLQAAAGQGRSCLHGERVDSTSCF